MDLILIHEGSFFKRSHVPLADLIQFVYWWTMDTVTQAAMKRETGMSSDHTIVDWCNFMRDVCAQYIIDHPRQIGGPGSTVEVNICASVHVYRLITRLY